MIENELFFSDIDEHLFLEINKHENIYTGFLDFSKWYSVWASYLMLTDDF